MLLRKLQLSLCVGGLLGLFACKTSENSDSYDLQDGSVDKPTTFRTSCDVNRRCVLYINKGLREIFPPVVAAPTTCQIDGPYLASPIETGFVISGCTGAAEISFYSPLNGYEELSFYRDYVEGSGRINTDGSGAVGFQIKGPNTLCIEHFGNFNKIQSTGENPSTVQSKQV